MSEYLIQESTLVEIASAIRSKTGSSQSFTPAQMVSAIMSISGGGSAADDYTVKVPEYDANNMFTNNSSIINVNIIPPCSFISSNRFYGDTIILSAIFPSASYIGESAFAYCETIESINASSCTIIGSNAFYECSSLASVYFPVCSTIYENAFYNCSSLEAVNFPSCMIIGSDAFNNCNALINASFPSCTIIESSAFCECSSLTNISFPVCTSIYGSAFYGCSSLYNLSFPAVEYIGGSAFGPFDYDASVSFYFLGNGSSVVSIDQSWIPVNLDEHEISIDYSLSIYVPASMYTAYLEDNSWGQYSNWIVSVST